MSSLELGSRFAAASDELVAAASLTVPHKPLGSAAETAMPATMMLSNTLGPLFRCEITFISHGRVQWQRVSSLVIPAA